jgi:hypothetical protein
MWEGGGGMEGGGELLHCEGERYREKGRDRKSEGIKLSRDGGKDGRD